MLSLICIASCRAVAAIVDMFVAWSASTVACADGSWFRIKLAQVWDGYARLVHYIFTRNLHLCLHIMYLVEVALPVVFS